MVQRLVDLPDVLTVKQFAAFLGIGRNTAYEAVRRGEILAVKIGRRLLIPRRAVERLLDGPRAIGDHSHD